MDQANCTLAEETNPPSLSLSVPRVTNYQPESDKLTADKDLIKRRTNISFNALQTLILNLMIDNPFYIQLRIRP